jgi:hypothetical protein
MTPNATVTIAEYLPPSSIDGTNLSGAGAVRNQLASLWIMASSLNSGLKFRWLGYFYNSFLVAVESGWLPRDAKPQPPPAKYCVVDFGEGQNNRYDIQQVTAEQNPAGGPVCDVPTWTLPIYSPSSGLIARP